MTDWKLFCGSGAVECNKEGMRPRKGFRINPQSRGYLDASLGQSAGPFKRFSSLIFTSALLGCFLNRRRNASLMTLANKNQILWLGWVAVVPNNSCRGRWVLSWPCREYVGHSETRECRATRANGSISSEGRGQSGLGLKAASVGSGGPETTQPHPSCIGQGRTCCHILNILGSD